MPPLGPMELRASVATAKHEPPPELLVRVVTIQGTPAANAVVGLAKLFCMGAVPERLDWSSAYAQSFALTNAEGRATLEIGISEACPVAAARFGEVKFALIQPGQTGELVIQLRPSALRWNSALLFGDRE